MKYIWENSKWPQFTWQSDKILSLLGKARRTQGEFLAQIKQLGFDLGNEARADILCEEAIKTASIEGERLNVQDVRSSISRHLGLSVQGPQKTNRSVDGLIEVILDATQKYNEPLTAQRLLGWQAAFFPTGYSGLYKINAGQWRGAAPMQIVSGPVGRETVHYQAPPRQALEKMMREYLYWWEGSKEELDGILRSAIAHFYFVIIHPFEDGNGRIARVLTDMALAQDECLGVRYYSISSQIMEERQGYYDALGESSCSQTMDITAWLRWFLECYIRAIGKANKIMEDVLSKAAFWQVHLGVGINERQQKVVQRILAAGKHKFKGGLTTRKYIAITKTSRATALRDIKDLLDKKVLCMLEGQGRNVHYDLVWPE